MTAAVISSLKNPLFNPNLLLDITGDNIKITI